MSEDFRTIYKILSILQKSMDYEVVDIRRLSADNLDITEPKRKALLGMLLKNGYVEGFQAIQYIGDPTPNIEGARIPRRKQLDAESRKTCKRNCGSTIEHN